MEERRDRKMDWAFAFATVFDFLFGAATPWTPMGIVSWNLLAGIFIGAFVTLPHISLCALMLEYGKDKYVLLRGDARTSYSFLNEALVLPARILLAGTLTRKIFRLAVMAVCSGLACFLSYYVLVVSSPFFRVSLVEVMEILCLVVIELLGVAAIFVLFMFFIIQRLKRRGIIRDERREESGIPILNSAVVLERNEKSKLLSTKKDVLAYRVSMMFFLVTLAVWAFHLDLIPMNIFYWMDASYYKEWGAHDGGFLAVALALLYALCNHVSVKRMGRRIHVEAASVLLLIGAFFRFVPTPYPNGLISRSAFVACGLYLLLQLGSVLYGRAKRKRQK